MWKQFQTFIAISLVMLACTLSGSGTNNTNNNVNTNGNVNEVAETSVPTESSATDTPVPATDTPVPPSATPTDDTVTVNVSIDTNCRSGPRIDYSWITAVTVGETVEAAKRPPGSQPYLVVLSDQGLCWLWLEYATVSGNAADLPIAAVPPTPTPVPPGSIEGVVWLDICSSGDPGDPPQGCLEGDPNVYYGNGLLENGEPGIEGVVVDLGEGHCPSIGYDTTTTDGSGIYYFADVPAGDYCVSIDPLTHGNDSDLIPGGWTHPLSNEVISQRNITVDPGEDIIWEHFGWDFQFD